MKKLLAILLALAMVLSLSVTALAAGESSDETDPTDPGTDATVPTVGSITITNATIGTEYKLYKIFDATLNFSADGKTTESIAYTIQKENADGTKNTVFTELFGADGKTPNEYFSYNEETGNVIKHEGVDDAKLIKYLQDLVNDGKVPVVKETTAQGAEVKFEKLPFGYYVIKSGLGTAVTINSNSPDVKVIDKNQEGATGFTKLVRTKGDTTGYATSNEANIGDVNQYKISFNATNYDGIGQIKYYQIHDEKGSAIWADFKNSIQISVGEQKLKRGWYLDMTDEHNETWTALGEWDEVTQTRDNAQWYLVQTGTDTFRITIPWLVGLDEHGNSQGHVIEEIKDANGIVVSYKVTYPGVAVASKYTSPSKVVITYEAGIEADANIGGAINPMFPNSANNLFNKAHATWTCENETGSSNTSVVNTSVHGIAILKDDGTNGRNLAGAEFRLYSDKECTDRVYVIPTDIDGVYMVDSKNREAEKIEGEGQMTSREYYNYESDTQDNLVVSQVNGKLVVLGLRADTYYLQEVKAPAGYNALTSAQEIKAGEGITTFSVFANANGDVKDIQQTDGTYFRHDYAVTSMIVHNSRGTQLPTTGGETAMKLITFGSILAIGFAVLLITQKKMSVYKD